MFDKQKITAILPAKSGIGKNGKPYSFYKIKTDRWGDKVLTTFGDQVTAKWQIGDEIEIKVTESVSADGKYTNYNFEYPKKPSPSVEIEKIKIRLDFIERHLGIKKEEGSTLSQEDKNHVVDLRNAYNAKSEPVSYPSDEINVDDIPF